MAEPEIIVPIKAGSISIDQQVPLIDVKIEQNYFNPQKMLENLQKQWRFTSGQDLEKNNQGPIEPVVLVRNNGTQGLGYEGDNTSTTIKPNASIRDTFIMGEIIVSENDNYNDLNILFLDLLEVNVLEGIPVHTTTN